MVWKYALIVVVGYLLGSVSSAIIYIRKKYHVDVREEGSGNAGATNVARTHGVQAGLITLGLDMVKTALSALFGYWLAGSTGVAVACAAAITGHCWPVYFGFRGGKGVSVAACIALLLDWRMFLILFAVFAVVFLLTRRISACSISCAAVYPIVYWLLHPGFGLEHILCLFICVLVIFLHRSNIRRLLKGEEAEFRPKPRERK